MKDITCDTLHKGTVDCPTPLRKEKVLPYNTKRVFNVRVVDSEVTILEYEFVEVIRHYDDLVTSTSRELCVLVYPVYFQ